MTAPALGLTYNNTAEGAFLVNTTGSPTPDLYPRPLPLTSTPDLPDTSSDNNFTARPPTARRATRTGPNLRLSPNPRFKLTDQGNAERLVHRHRDHVLYVPTAGWHVWDGSRWVYDQDQAHVHGLAVETVRSMYGDAGADSEDGSRSSLAKHALSSESLPRLNAAVKLASHDLSIRVTIPELNADPYLFNVKNGTIDLRTGVLKAADPADLITRQSPVVFDPAAVAPEWSKFLEEVIPDPDERAYLKRSLGYGISGLVKHHKLWILEGNGRNGKTVIVERMLTIMGDYGYKAPATLLMARNNDSDNTNDVAGLNDARFVAVTETEQNRAIAESRVKELTGGDTVRARFLHREFFEFKPKAKFFLITNYRPRVTGTDDGIWERLLRMVFRVQVPESRRDESLGERIDRTELPGVLAWLVEGFADYFTDEKLRIPVTILTDSKEYREEQDVMGAFIADQCVTGNGARVGGMPLYQEYRRWCADNGHNEKSQTSLGIDLKRRGYVRRKASSIIWEGIGLKNTTDNPWPPTSPPPSGPPLALGPECRTCGQPCSAVNEGLHPSCEEPLVAASTGPEQPPLSDVPSEEAGVSLEAVPEIASNTLGELEAPRGHVAAVRSARYRSNKVTVYLNWAAGRGVVAPESAVKIHARARVADLVTDLSREVERIVLCSAPPANALNSWATDPLPEGWTHGDHYLDPESFTGRYLGPNGRKLEVRLLSSWAREKSNAQPKIVAAAFALFHEGVEEIFGVARQKPGEPVEHRAAPALLGSPATMGRELLLRSLPSGREYPVLSAEHQALLHGTVRQGRTEYLRPDETVPDLYSYDMRWSYARMCQRVQGTGPATLDNGEDSLDSSGKLRYAPGRYLVEWTVPAWWNHVGLLQTEDKDWPRRPGEKGRGWVDARELRLAEAYEWRIGHDVRIKQRLMFTNDKTTPLRTWSDKLIELRQEWLPRKEQEGVSAAVVELAQDITRTTLLAGVGALQGSRQRVTHCGTAQEIPDGALATASSGGLYVWTTEEPAAWLEMAHPEWSSQVWAEQRVRLLDTGRAGEQPNAGALHIPFREVIGLRTDAVYSTTDPGWPDSGQVGSFRLKLALSGPVTLPRTGEDLPGLGGR